MSRGKWVKHERRRKWGILETLICRSQSYSRRNVRIIFWYSLQNHIRSSAKVSRIFGYAPSLTHRSYGTPCWNTTLNTYYSKQVSLSSNWFIWIEYLNTRSIETLIHTIVHENWDRHEFFGESALETSRNVDCLKLSFVEFVLHLTYDRISFESPQSNCSTDRSSIENGTCNPQM